MGTLRIGTDSLGLGYGHTFIEYENDGGNKFQIHGTPQGGSSVGFSYSVFGDNTPIEVIERKEEGLSTDPHTLITVAGGVAAGTVGGAAIGGGLVEGYTEGVTRFCWGKLLIISLLDGSLSRKSTRLRIPLLTRLPLYVC